MITLEQYWKGRDVSHASELTEEIRHNAGALVDRVNLLLQDLKSDATGVNSGWRPPTVNEVTPGAARLSNHMTGRAVDVSDPNRALARAILRNAHLLESNGLYMEQPSCTKGWVHLQSVPPLSGRRIFSP